MAVNPTVLTEGAPGAATSGVVRRRRRSPRVRRDPIDIELVEAEAAEAADAAPANGAGAVLAALEAEVDRVAAIRASIPSPPEPEAEPAIEQTPTAPPTFIAPPPRTSVPGSGIEADQVREWMAHVQEDLRKVRARLEYLRVEQARLDEQQRLMAQLLTSSTPL
jgi:hypothetical protein